MTSPHERQEFEPYSPTFRELLQVAIRKAGSRLAFASLVGVAARTVDYWCSSTLPTWKDWPRIALAMGITIEDLAVSLARQHEVDGTDGAVA